MKKLLIRILFITFLTFFLSCKKSNNGDIELNILNKEILTYSSINSKDTINTIRYSIKNNTDEIYLLNGFILTDSINKIFNYGILKNGVNLKVFDSIHKELNPNFSPKKNSDNSECFSKYLYDFRKNEFERLGYSKENFKYLIRNENYNIIFLHPKEELFFEYTLSLKKVNDYELDRIGYFDFIKNKQYNFQLSIASDNLSYVYALPRNILKTIEANKVKVYHGIIESKNTVPVKVLE